MINYTYRVNSKSRESRLSQRLENNSGVENALASLALHVASLASLHFKPLLGGVAHVVTLVYVVEVDGMLQTALSTRVVVAVVGVNHFPGIRCYL